MKKDEENKRRESRVKKEHEAKQLWEQGNKDLAYKCFQQAVRVSKTMMFTLIKALKEINIDFIVAPFEADSELAYLFKTKQIDFVISEDSDLLVFGISKVFYKMVCIQHTYCFCFLFFVFCFFSMFYVYVWG